MTEDEQNEMEELQNSIRAMEGELRAAKDRYRELKTARLRVAVEAKREAEKALQGELRAMGLGYSAYQTPTFPSTFLWRSLA
jgi:hypothetical protein